MSFDEHAGPRTRLLGLSVIQVVVVLAALVAGLYVLKGVTGSSGDDAGRVKGSGDGDTFTIVYPKDWRPLSKDELESLPGHPAAVVRREDGKGFMVIRKEGRAPSSFDKFSSQLTREFQNRVPDFQKRRSRTVEVRAGKAFFYSYIRKQRGTVHTVVVVPAGKRSYALNTVSRGDAKDVAEEIGKMILSFDT